MDLIPGNILLHIQSKNKKKHHTHHIRQFKFLEIVLGANINSIVLFRLIVCWMFTSKQMERDKTHFVSHLKILETFNIVQVHKFIYC